jgi:hypothetical protein
VHVPECGNQVEAEVYHRSYPRQIAFERFFNAKLKGHIGASYWRVLLGFVIGLGLLTGRIRNVELSVVPLPRFSGPCRRSPSFLSGIRWRMKCSLALVTGLVRD